MHDRISPPAGVVTAPRTPPRAARRRVGLLAGLAVALVLAAGCGATSAAQQGPAPAPGSTGTAAADAAAQYAAGTPPAAAQMVCSEEIRGEVADALQLTSVPEPTPAWAEHVYTCPYALPMGRLVLSVTVTPSSTAAGDQLAAMRARLPGAADETGLGEQAVSSPAGTVIARKDALVLTVDATGLPGDLGTTHESQLDLARVLAAGVFNCWTGSS